MSWTCSRKLAGIPAGVSAPGSAASRNRSAAWIGGRFPGRSSGIRRVSAGRGSPAQSGGRGCRRGRNPGWNAAVPGGGAGSWPLARGAGAEEPLEGEAGIRLGGQGHRRGRPRQVELVAHEYPESQLPDFRAASQASSIEGNRVRWPIRWPGDLIDRNSRRGYRLPRSSSP